MPGYGQPAGIRNVRTVLFSMYAHGYVKPKRVYLSANAGPWLKALQWKGWGTAKAVAHGTYISDCASCPPPKRRTVTLRLSKPVVCTEGEGKGLRTYRKAVVTLSAPDQGSTVRTFRIPAGCP